MMEWIEQQLSDFMYFNPPTPLRNDSIAKKVAMEHLRPYNKKIQEYEEATFKGGTKFKNNDTLMARITPCLENGKTAFVDFLDDEEVAFGSTEFIVLRAKEGISDSKFIFYFAISSEFRDTAIQLMSGTSGRQRVETEVLKQKVFILPSLPEQKAIAEVLSSLDDKIDLLTRQNKTLEDLAQTHFRKWFIEDTRDEWEIDILGNYVDISRGASPRPIIKYVEYGTFPWVKIGDATSSSSMFVYKTKERITEEGIAKSVIAYKGEIILSNSATCGFPYIMGIDGCIHDGWLLFRNYRRLTKWYIYFLLRSMYREITIQADGTVQDNLNTNILKNLHIYIPDDKLIETFDTFAESCIQKIIQNDAQIRTLERLRNTLLSKLISGEIRVKM